jgi:uncharacterized protein
MKKAIVTCALLAAASAPAAPAAAQPVTGTRVDIVATGEVERVPDMARINTGVMTQAPTATEAIRQNAAQMERMREALRGAGVEERDIQTSSINLHPEWHHRENQAPQFAGYRAHNMLTVRFRDVANAGRILDTLVESGANQIDGPTLFIDRPEAALDEARAEALANARARADLYARQLGMRVRRILSVSEAGLGYFPPPPMAVGAEVRVAGSRIAPGEQTLSVSLTVSFELE